MQNNDYFKSDEFLELLHKYEEARRNDSSVFFDLQDFNDLIEYYNAEEHADIAEQVVDTALTFYPGASYPLSFKAKMSIWRDHNIKDANYWAEQISDKESTDYYYIQGEILLAENKPQESDNYLCVKLPEVSYDEYEDFILDVAQLFLYYNEVELSKKWISMSNLKDDPDYLDLKGNLAIIQGNYHDAEKLFDSLIDDAPYDSTLWNRLAAMQLLNNDAESSINSSDFSLAIDPSDTDAMLNKANALSAIGNHEDALKLYTKYHELKPEDEMGEILIGHTYSQLGKYEEALRYLKHALVSVSKHHSALFLFHDILMVYSKMGDYKGATEFIRELPLANMLSESDLCLLNAHLVCSTGHPEEAYNEFQKAIKLCDDIEDVLMKITITALDDCPSQGYRVLVDYISEHQDTIHGWSHLTLLCKKLGLDDEAKKAEAEARKRNPIEARQILDEDITQY